MLKELYLEHKDGRSETKLLHLNPGEQVSIQPRRDGITFSNCKTFVYKVPKHPYLSPTIIRLGGKYKIMPHGIECHPKTTMDDIKVIVKRKNKPRVKKEKWTFESSNGNGTYTVTKQEGVIKCNCMGFWRSKGNCKHVKQVRNEN